MGNRAIAKNLRRVRNFYTHRPDAFDVDAYLAGTAPFPTLLSRKLPEVFGGTSSSPPGSEGIGVRD